jgi:hypothetical protein
MKMDPIRFSLKNSINTTPKLMAFYPAFIKYTNRCNLKNQKDQTPNGAQIQAAVDQVNKISTET